MSCQTAPPLHQKREMKRGRERERGNEGDRERETVRQGDREREEKREMRKGGGMEVRAEGKVGERERGGGRGRGRKREREREKKGGGKVGVEAFTTRWPFTEQFSNNATKMKGPLQRVNNLYRGRQERFLHCYIIFMMILRPTCESVCRAQLGIMRAHPHPTPTPYTPNSKSSALNSTLYTLTLYTLNAQARMQRCRRAGTTQHIPSKSARPRPTGAELSSTSMVSSRFSCN